MHKKKSNKIKVGTILDADVYKRLKLRAAKESKSISDILHDAILRYEQSDEMDKRLRMRALENLFSVRFNIPTEDWKEIMDEDYYDQ